MPLDTRADAALVAMRQILRAAEINAKRLAGDVGLAPTQITVLGYLTRTPRATAGELARRVGVRQPTMTALIDKLAARAFVERNRDDADRRRVWISITPDGRAALSAAPDTLQHMFESRFASLETWEQAFLVAALERVANLIGAEDLDAAPVLDVGAIDETPDI